ncbi:hypothetical protein [Vibrio sp. 10N.247.310.17]|uniref:hypothetical protein n=1 Tax=Vibrio sp. 10N.247.310.17 TaxID=3229979 RepID=UPI00354ECBAB
MDFSRHKQKNGVVKCYAYYEYETLPESQRTKQKGELYCYGCNAPTKFSKSSIDGKQACFGLMPGRKHEKHCEEIKKTNEGATKRRKLEEKHYIEAVEKIQNSTDEIEIDSESLALFEKIETKVGKTCESTRPRQSSSKAVGSSKRHAIDSEQIRSSRKNLVQLLKFCLYSSRFLKGKGLTLKFKGRSYESVERIKQFFQANSISNTKIPYFFYGSIRGTDESLTFIHVGAEKVQVIIDESIRNHFWNALEVDKYWQLLDAQIICFGWLNRSESGNCSIKIKDMCDIAIIDVKVNPDFESHSTVDSQNIEEVSKPIVKSETTVQEYEESERSKLGFNDAKGIEDVERVAENIECSKTAMTYSAENEDVLKQQMFDQSQQVSTNEKQKGSWWGAILSFFKS